MSIETFLSVLIGGLVTWLASWRYYKKAGDELRAETELIKKSNRVIAYILENLRADIEVRRDVLGNPVAIIVSASAHASGKASANDFAADGDRSF